MRFLMVFEDYYGLDIVSDIEMSCIYSIIIKKC